MKKALEKIKTEKTKGLDGILIKAWTCSGKIRWVWLNNKEKENAK